MRNPPGFMTNTPSAPKTVTPVRTIALLLCNHAFEATLRNLLETVRRALIYRKGESFPTADEMETIIRDLLVGHYAAFQRRQSNTQEDAGREIEYLKSHVRIQFDEEAQKSISTLDHDNGSYYLDIQSGTIGSF